MGIVYVAEGYDFVKIGRCEDETQRQIGLKNEFDMPTGFFLKLAFRCKKPKKIEDKFLLKFKKYKVERYKGSTRDTKSRESFDREKMSTIIKKMKKYAEKKGYFIKYYKPNFEYENFDSILDKRETEHGSEFLVKWMNGEESWIHYDCIPESFILEEGWETHDMLDIPEAPGDDSDDEWNGSDDDLSDEDISGDDDSDEEPEAQFTDYDEDSSEDESEDEEETNPSNRKRPAEGQDSPRKRRKPASSR